MPRPLLTTRDVANKLGVSERRVLQIANARGIEPAMRVGGACIWRALDLKRFALRPSGRPKTK